jgi:hypothetical protein
MTATLQPSGVGARPPRHPIAIALGVLAITVGLLTAAAAIGLLAVFGTSGELHTGRQQISSTSAAVVSDVARLRAARGVGGVTGTPSLRLSAVPGPGTTSVFIGVGPAPDVDRYLADVAVDEVTDVDLDPFDLTVQRHGGTAAAAPPSEQSFWVAAADSPSSAELTWPVQGGDYRLVVMNSDGSAGVDTRIQLRLSLRHAFPIGVSVLAGGALVAVLGAGVVANQLAGGRRRGRTRRGDLRTACSERLAQSPTTPGGTQYPPAGPGPDRRPAAGTGPAATAHPFAGLVGSGLRAAPHRRRGGGRAAPDVALDGLHHGVLRRAPVAHHPAVSVAVE